MRRTGTCRVSPTAPTSPNPPASRPPRAGKHDQRACDRGLKRAAFFGYFLCSSKESDCRPAQGRANRPIRNQASQKPRRIKRCRGASPKRHREESKLHRGASASNGAFAEGKRQKAEGQKDEKSEAQDSRKCHRHKKTHHQNRCKPEGRTTC